MRAIVTVVGKDRVGIIAGICGVLAGLNVNVLDISQTILQEVFVMNMLVDIKEANVSFAAIVEALEREGERLGMSVRIQLEEIFNAMHKI
ncbi:MAG: ACT domain-containing protein [Oscillospiraceae bacterium]|nr:ACT domain-containing protein [Oscillospiraceae bacterium]